MKSNLASLVLGHHKKEMIMVPKGRPCTSTFLMCETGIRPCCVICEYRHTALLDNVLLYLIAALGSEGLCCFFGGNPEAWLLSANSLWKMSTISSQWCVWSLLFKVCLPSAAKHRSANAIDLFLWWVLIISVPCRKFLYVMSLSNCPCLCLLSVWVNGH